jgi:uncharacterized membrane protein YeaQ/YmgE (transglycosylase-associated protein family)
MGIIAWIRLGLAAGLVASMLIPGRRQQGLILTCLIGIAGALLGGWAATKIFHIHTLHGFFNLSPWLTAITGAAILLLAYHLLTSQSGRSGRSSRSRRYARRQGKHQNDPAQRLSPVAGPPKLVQARRLLPRLDHLPGRLVILSADSASAPGQWP